MLCATINKYGLAVLLPEICNWVGFNGGPSRKLVRDLYPLKKVAESLMYVLLYFI